MYAIRSYYVRMGSAQKADPTEQPGSVAELAARVGAHFRESADLKQSSAELLAAPIVITSYSIHYTKLYDVNGANFVRRADCVQQAVLRITSYNVCYTKLLRAIGIVYRVPKVIGDGPNGL